MPTDHPVYTDRQRAESFGSVAKQYDRYRPSYPDALIADLADLNPDRVLDIGTGTGKVAVPLVACGMAVLGLEVDPAMADIARTHGIFVEVGAFETWDDDGRTFDLITSGQAWHWIDPERGVPKVARLLNPGGTLALFWNYDDLDGALKKAFDDVYQKHAPEIVHIGGDHDDADRPYVDTLKASGNFDSVTTKQYRWERTFTTDEWIGRAATHSDHIRLPDDQRKALLDALREVIDQHGGSVHSHFGTYTVFARTADK